MFDKNSFKENFRIWSEENPMASAKEVENYCDCSLPAKNKAQYQWLMEESINWYMWKQENLKTKIRNELDSSVIM